MPREYKTYVQAERLSILATAVTEQLSATKVQQRFGVKPVTYYSWRKKNGLKSPRGRRRRHEAGGIGTDTVSNPESGMIADGDPGMY